MHLGYHNGVFTIPTFWQKRRDILHPYDINDFYTPYGFIFPLENTSLNLKLFFEDGVKGVDTISRVTMCFVLDASGTFFRYFIATADDSVTRAFISRRIVSLRDDWLYAFSTEDSVEEQLTALFLKYQDADKALSSFTRLQGYSDKPFAKITKSEIIENLKQRGFTKRFVFEDRVEATLED